MDKIAFIREAECIGCIKCIKACSDQAILGARKQMHTILTDLCTGCEDCIAICPVDCIEMVEKPKQTLSPSVEPLLARNTEIYANIENTSSSAKKETIQQAIARTMAKRKWTIEANHDPTKMPRDI